ncbi:MAG: ferritin-like domain-containing protein [Promicromonosporaceae bacterium]|nr:ferritin-like domain-containing protein [Promicromonosporaceae bacterium]
MQTPTHFGQSPKQMAFTLPGRRPGGRALASRLRAGARAGLAACCALVLLVLLGGCTDLRLDTAPPTEPIPDAFELVRRTAVDDVLFLIARAESALSGDLDEPIRVELERVIADAQAHYAALGGTYVSGLELEAGEGVAAGEGGEAGGGAVGAGVVPAPGADPAANLVEAATWPQVAESLFAAGLVNRVTANEVPSGDVARLLAAIGTNQTIHAITLWELGGNYTAQYLIPENPTEIVDPAGVTVSDFQAIIKSEDAARFAFEVAAARNEGDVRAMLLLLSREHGERAAYWALASHVTGTDQDPRLVAYQVPAGMTASELVMFLEVGISEIWADLIPVAAAGTRTLVIEEFLATTVTAHQWGAAPATFPGMPEIETMFGGAPAMPDEPRLPPMWAEMVEEDPVVTE